MPADAADKAGKRYSNRKYSLHIVETVYALALICAFAVSGLSLRLTAALAGAGIPQFFMVGSYLLIAGLFFSALTLPFSFYGSFVLEHQFNLSRQSLGGWMADQAKAGAVGYVIGYIMIGVFYWTLARFPSTWWLAVWLIWGFFSLVLAKLAPVIIIPLFFRSTKLSDEELRRRILALAGKMKVAVMDVFEIDLGKKTVKANAAFTGWGSTRRVLLADTLTHAFTPDEIEVILAHEFAHYRLRHIWKLIAINSLVTLSAFYLIYATSEHVLAAFHVRSLHDVASLPVVFIYFSLLGVLTQPVQAGLSRGMEREADRMALEITGAREAFISSMEKLSQQNLSDRDPHPLIKFYFFDHPPIDERIAMARAFR